MGADLKRTLRWLETIAARHDEVLVGLSGGKDSLACVDLCIRAGFKRIECYALHFIPGLGCFDGPVDRAAKLFGLRFTAAVMKRVGEPAAGVVPLTVHKLTHPDGANALAYYAIFRPHILEAVTGKRRVPRATMNDAYRLAREKSGIRLLCTGERMDESLQRRGQLHGHAACDRTHLGPDQCGELNPPTSTKRGQPICSGDHEGWRGAYAEKEMRFWPLWDWSARDVLAYLRTRNIPIPGGLGKANMSGVDLRLETLRHIKEHFPEDFEKLVEAFPDCEVQFAREDFKKMHEAENAKE